MLRIYFDGTQIADDNIVGLTQKARLFNNNFHLGSTVCREFDLSVYSESALTIPSEVVIKDLVDTTETLVATLIVDSVEEDCGLYNFILVDRMILGNEKYDYSSLVPCQLHVIVDDICDKIGVTAPSGYTGYNRTISNYDSNRTMRDYLGYVAEINAGFCRIKANNTLEFVAFETSQQTISIDDCSSFVLGSKFEFDGIEWTPFKYPTDSENPIFINEDNMFIEDDDLEDIWDTLEDFEFYNIQVGDCPINASIMPGDIITFSDGINTYDTIAEISWLYSSEWIGGYNLNLQSSKQESTSIDSTSEKIRNVSIKVNHNANLIELQGSRIDTLDNKTEQQSIHFYIDGDQGQAVVSKDGIVNNQYPDAYTTFKEDGVRVWVNGSAVTELTANGTNCNEGLGVQDWNIQRGSTNTINFFRRV